MLSKQSCVIISCTVFFSDFLQHREFVSLLCTRRDFTTELETVTKARKEEWSKIVIKQRRSKRIFESSGDNGDDYDRCRSNIGRMHFAITDDVRKMFCRFLSNADLAYFLGVEAETRFYEYSIPECYFENIRAGRRVYLSNYLRAWERYAWMHRRHRL